MTRSAINVRNSYQMWCSGGRGGAGGDARHSKRSVGGQLQGFRCSSIPNKGDHSTETSTKKQTLELKDTSFEIYVNWTEVQPPGSTRFIIEQAPGRSGQTVAAPTTLVIYRRGASCLPRPCRRGALHLRLLGWQGDPGPPLTQHPPLPAHRPCHFYIRTAARISIKKPISAPSVRENATK